MFASYIRAGAVHLVMTFAFRASVISIVREREGVCGCVGVCIISICVYICIYTVFVYIIWMYICPLIHFTWRAS